MAKTQDLLLRQLQQFLMSNLASSQQQAQQESPYLTGLGQDAGNFQNILRGGDYNQLPGGYQMNMSPVAMQGHAAELNANPLGHGTSAAGIQPSGAYGLDQQGQRENLFRNYTGARQSNIDQGANSTNKVLMGLGGLEQERKSDAAHQQGQMLGSVMSAYNNKKPGFWGSLLKGGIQAAPAILAAI